MWQEENVFGGWTNGRIALQHMYTSLSTPPLCFTCPVLWLAGSSVEKRELAREDGTGKRHWLSSNLPRLSLYALSFMRLVETLRTAASRPLSLNLFGTRSAWRIAFAARDLGYEMTMHMLVHGGGWQRESNSFTRPDVGLTKVRHIHGISPDRV